MSASITTTGLVKNLRTHAKEFYFENLRRVKYGARQDYIDDLIDPFAQTYGYPSFWKLTAEAGSLANQIKGAHGEGLTDAAILLAGGELGNPGGIVDHLAIGSVRDARIETKLSMSNPEGYDMFIADDQMRYPSAGGAHVFALWHLAIAGSKGECSAVYPALISGRAVRKEWRNSKRFGTRGFTLHPKFAGGRSAVALGLPIGRLNIDALIEDIACLLHDK